MSDAPEVPRYTNAKGRVYQYRCQCCLAVMTLRRASSVCAVHGETGGLYLPLEGAPAAITVGMWVKAMRRTPGEFVTWEYLRG